MLVASTVQRVGWQTAAIGGADTMPSLRTVANGDASGRRAGAARGPWLGVLASLSRLAELAYSVRAPRVMPSAAYGATRTHVVRCQSGTAATNKREPGGAIFWKSAAVAWPCGEPSAAARPA
jgi:hypothetical protein